ncbi:MAG: FadR/GntR family transcriptional regulator [Cellvibrionaceae bacterium]
MSNERLYKTVVDQIVTLIDSGEFPVGTRLPPERELAERFNVSRPTIREAVIALETLERVVVKPGSGVYAQDIKHNANDLSDISAFELTEARALFEGEAAALAANMISEDELGRIENTLLAMKGESNELGLSAEAADKEFHLIIAQATRNKSVLSVIKHLWHIRDNIPKVKHVYQSVCEIDADQRVLEHEEIYNALVKGDAGTARTAMHKHFARLLNKLLAAAEAEEMEAARTKALKSRERFSLDHLLT